ALFDLHGAEKIGVAAGPVRDIDIRIEGMREFTPNTRSGKQILQFQTNARYLALHAIEFLVVIEMNQRQPGIVLVHADFEDTDDVELLEPRHDSGPRHLALRRDDNNLVAESRANAERQFTAQHNTEFSRLQRAKAAGFHVHADVGHFVFVRGHDAAND